MVRNGFRPSTVCPAVALLGLLSQLAGGREPRSWGVKLAFKEGAAELPGVP